MLTPKQISALDQTVVGGESMLTQLANMGKVDEDELKNRSNILAHARAAVTELQRADTPMKDPHVDAWLDRVTMNPGPGEAYARWWLEQARYPAWKQAIYKPIMEQHKLFCTWNGQQWRVTGASSMGDIWLAADINRVSGYDERVPVAECSEWSAEPPPRCSICGTDANLHRNFGSHGKWRCDSPECIPY